MRTIWLTSLVVFAGCLPTNPDDAPTQQVASKPFQEPRRAAPIKVSFAPASQETSLRVLLMKDALLQANKQLGPNIYAIAIGSADPEVFHVGLNHVYITEGLVRQCSTDGLLAAVLANELGRIISEREAAVADEVRQPERLPPIRFTTGSVGSGLDRDPIGHIELAKHEKLYPKQTRKLARPDAQLLARDILERAGYLSTDLDAALPLLQNSERFRALEHQFKGTIQQADWKMQ